MGDSSPLILATPRNVRGAYRRVARAARGAIAHSPPPADHRSERAKSLEWWHQPGMEWNRDCPPRHGAEQREPDGGEEKKQATGLHGRPPSDAFRAQLRTQG